MIISRKLINPNFYHVTENVDYKTLCKKINKFKHLFLSKGATKEDNISVGTLTADTDTIACYFAIWELGMSLALVEVSAFSSDSLAHMNKVVSENFTNYKNRTFLTAFTIHDLYKPIDPNNSGGLTRMDLKDGLFRKILEKYGDNNTTILEMRDMAPMPGTDIQPWEVDENDVAIQNINNVLKIKRPTDFWFPKESTHKEVLESVEKYIPDFTQDRIAISRNLYHNESIDFYFLPTLMTASKIYDTNVMDYLERKEEQQIFNFMVDYVNKEIEKNKIERILVPDETMYNYMQNKKTKPFEHEVIFNIDKKIVKSN